MSNSHRPPRAPSWGLRARPLDAQIRGLALIAGGLIALVATIALGTGFAIGHPSALGGEILGSATVRWVAAGAVAFVVLAAAALLALMVRTTARTVAGTIGHTAVLIDRIAAGDFAPAIPPAPVGAEDEVARALDRLLRVMRRNADAAEALAAGQFRRVTPAREARDPVGVALGQIAHYMDDVSATANRIARGDLNVDVASTEPGDSFGQANGAMIRQVAAVLRDVAAMKQAITATTSAMQKEVDSLVGGTTEDSDLLRRAADRVSQIALQAHAGAERAAALEERSLEGAQLVRDGVTAAVHSIGTLNDVIHSADVVQSLARDAGLVAVRAASLDAVAVAMRPELPEDEARQLATQAAVVAGTMRRLTLVGAAAAGESQRVLDRIGDSVHDGRRLVHELTAMSRSHAAALLEIDESVSDAHLTSRHNAAAARQLAHLVDSLNGHSRRLDSVLRRFHKGGGAILPAGELPMTGPVLYRSPTDSHAAQSGRVAARK